MYGMRMQRRDTWMPRPVGGVIPPENLLGVQQRAVLPISERPEEAVKEEDNMPVGREQIGQAREQYMKYRMAKQSMDARIAENEDWWRGQHLEYIRKKQKRETDTTSAWMFNSIENKHADAMDNYPTVSVQPREISDRYTADALSSVLPVVLEQCDFENTWNKLWRYKLKMGMGCYGVFWDSDKLHGMGDVTIEKIDVLNLFWEYGINDIQDSRNLYYVSKVDTDLLEEEYPELKGQLGERKDTVKYNYDQQTEAKEKTAVIEWYYKRKNAQGKTIVHYCKFTGEHVLYATENDPELHERGLYDHGMYPFVLDMLFELEGTLDAFGYVDVMKGVQTRIDRLMNAVTDNAQRSAHKRYLKRDNAGINEDEFKDLTQDIIHVTDGMIDENSLRELETQPLPGSVLTVLNNYIEELKETSGNRDVSQGGTTSGVTAASAIAAMMEAGSKLSRDMIKNGYRAFRQVCEMVLECMRQFYTEERYFRITDPNGGEQFVGFSNAGMVDQPKQVGLEIMARRPIFDVVVKVQKSSPYSRLAQNEMVKEFYSLGFFNPQQADQSLAALRMMDFDGKDEIIKTVEKNGTMYNMLNGLQSLVVQMTAMIDPDGSQGILNALQQRGWLNVPGQQMPALNAAAAQGDITTNALGAPMGRNNLVERARLNAQESTAPR